MPEDIELQIDATRVATDYRRGFQNMIKNYDKAKKLEGTWGDKDNWAEYRVHVTKNDISVSAKDVDSGDNYPVSNIEWDGLTLSFDCLVPYEGWLIHHKLVPNRGATVLHTTVFKDVLKKRKSTSGSMRCP